MGRVLGVLVPEGGNGTCVLLAIVGRQARLLIRHQNVTAPTQAKPAEPRPVLGPAVEENRRLGPSAEAADPGEGPRVVGPLRLLVERAVKTRAGAGIVATDDEADRD